MIQFPKNFLWGAATSAPQSEGAAAVDGKSPTIWDKWFELAPERFHEGQGPAVTSDVYHLYKDEVQRMKTIGLNSFRTSISWSRLLPDGRTLNEKAVAFYRDYFSELNKNGIAPIINLFHFDMPWWLMERGGWEVRESVEHFAFYAKTAFECFGDLVKRWTTFNEPLIHIESGYLLGYHYPAKHDLKLAVQVGYHTLMAHVRAVEEFRKLQLPAAQIGLILNVAPAYARSGSAEDQLAKERADNLLIYSFLDPAVLGEVPAFLKELLAKNDLTPQVVAADTELIRANTVDFMGMNYYQPLRVKAPEMPRFPARDLSDFFSDYIWEGRRMNEYRGWEIFPEALCDVALLMKEKYHNIPWYVSENGMGVADEERFTDENGLIQDDYRIAFVEEHLEQLARGIAAGSNCFGYHVWTFADCWSWLNGYRNRYGLYRVDIENGGQRSLKRSGLWFKELTEKNGF